MSATMRFERFQLVDIQVDTSFGGSSINIPEQPMLRTMRITGIETYTDQDFQTGSPITGNPLPTQTQLMNTFFIGYTGDPQKEEDTGEYVYLLPLIRLHNLVSAATPNTSWVYATIPLRFDDLNFKWDKCQLKFAIPPNSIGSFTISYVLGVYYTSRRDRMMKSIHSAVSGITNEEFADFLTKKVMWLESLLNKVMGRKTDM